MTTKLAYQVTHTTEYSNGESKTHEPRLFAVYEKAIAYAAEITHASNVNGTFAGEWRPNYAAQAIDPAFANEEDWPAQIRITATVKTVTLDEIDSQL